VAELVEANREGNSDNHHQNADCVKGYVEHVVKVTS
jgi:hypothetical protein